MEIPQRRWLTLASIDPGTVNLAYFVGRVLLAKVLDLALRYKRLPRKLQKLTCYGAEVRELVRELMLAVRTLALDVVDLRKQRLAAGLGNEDVRDEVPASVKQGKAANVVTVELRRKLFRVLDDRAALWKKADVVIIEKQFFSAYVPNKGYARGPGRSAQVNINAVMIGECLASWFLVHFPHKMVVIFGSALKTQLLGAPRGLTKPQRKKWSTERAAAVFKERRDAVALAQMDVKKREKARRRDSLLPAKPKADDMADSFIQCCAFAFRNLVAGKE
jgi:hypothetical protein